jgi:protein TonB
MFEDSLFSSRAGAMTMRSRWTTVASVGVQATLLGVVLMAPLLKTEMLPMLVAAPKAVVMMPRVVPPPPPPVKTVMVKAVEGAYASATAAAPSLMRGESARVIHAEPAVAEDGPVLVAAGTTGFGIGSGSGFDAVSVGMGPRTVVSAGTPKKVRVSAGVSAGMLMEPIRPVYPRIAVAAKVAGTVVVTATISKDGRIVGAQAMSGPMMLRGAALDAVKAARYRPYLLNGEPTEVETTISVNFQMGT